MVNDKDPKDSKNYDPPKSYDSKSLPDRDSKSAPDNRVNVADKAVADARNVPHDRDQLTALQTQVDELQKKVDAGPPSKEDQKRLAELKEQLEAARKAAEIHPTDPRHPSIARDPGSATAGTLAGGPQVAAEANSGYQGLGSAPTRPDTGGDPRNPGKVIPNPVPPAKK